MIHQEAKIEQGTRLWYPELSNIGRCNIGENCTIHSHVWIGDGVKIGYRVKIQAYAFIPSGVTIEDDVFIGPRVTFTNDKYPPSPDWQETIVEKGASIGASVTILPGIIIGRESIIGAGSLVTKDVEAYTTVYGVPAKIQSPKDVYGHTPVQR